MASLKELLRKFGDTELKAEHYAYVQKQLILKSASGFDIVVKGCTEEQHYLLRQHIHRYFIIKDKEKFEDEVNRLLTWFKDTYNTIPSNVIAFGDPLDKITENFLEELIPFVDYQTNRYGPDYIKRTYRSAMAYGRPDYNYLTAMNNPKTVGLVVHESCMSSWLGVLQLLQKPKYVIIYKVIKNE